MHRRLFPILSLLVLLSLSCSKEQQNVIIQNEFHNNKVDSLRSAFSQSVIQNIANPSFKSFVLNNASLRFDGDFNFLIVPAFNQTKSFNSDFHIPPYLIDAIAKEDPLLQIYVLHPDLWTDDCPPLVIYLPEDFDDHATEFIDAHTPTGEIIQVKVKDTFDNTPVVVISRNERTVAVSSQMGETRSVDTAIIPIYESSYYSYYLQSDYYNSTIGDKANNSITKATLLEETAAATLLGPPYSTCERIGIFPSKDYISKVRPTSKSSWSEIEPAIMGDPELYFFVEFGNSLGGNLEVTKEKKYVGTGYKNRNNIQWKEVNLEIIRWSLIDNGAKMRYEWWEDDGGAIINHTSTIQIDLPDLVKNVIQSQSVEVTVSVGKKDDYAGAVYAYYVDENNHIYNTSYIMFELVSKQQ